jgi:hypothetical protein
MNQRELGKCIMKRTMVHMFFDRISLGGVFELYYYDRIAIYYLHNVFNLNRIGCNEH